MKKFILIPILLISICLNAATYYVAATGGDDAHPGTLAEPLLTINHALTHVIAGDSVIVRTGTYFEDINISDAINGTETDPIVIKAYKNESPIIDGTGIDPGGALVTIWGSYYYLEGFEIRNSNEEGTYGSSAGNGVTCIGDGILLDSLKIHNVWGSGIGSSGDYVIIEYCEVYDADLDNFEELGEGTWGSGISQRVGPSHGIIRHCVVHNCWGEGISYWEGDYGIVEDNIVYNCSSVNIYISDASHTITQRNLVYATSDFSEHTGRGISLSDEKFYEPQHDNICINNMVVGCRRSFSCGDPRNTIIANNTFVNSIYTNNVQIDTETTTTNSYFVNNIIVQENSSYNIYIYENTGDGSGITYSNNLFDTPANNINYTGTDDVVGDPGLAKIGTIEEGVLTSDYFKILVTSDAINNAVVMDEVTQDFFGRYRGNNPDIGADEYDVPPPSDYYRLKHNGKIIKNNKKSVVIEN